MASSLAFSPASLHPPTRPAHPLPLINSPPLRRIPPQPHSHCSNSTISRRLAFGLGLSILLPPFVPPPALAKDIPIFGIRKRVEKVEQEVVKDIEELVTAGEKEVTQLVSEGEKEVGAVAGVVKSFASSASVPVPSEGPPPVFQAGAVLGAELAAVLVAASVVNGLVSEP